MDVFIPEHRSTLRMPAVLWIHGGGWERGDNNGNSGAQLLVAQGFVTASLFYRLSGDSPFPADIEDCKCAIRFLRANPSRFGIDPERIGVAGASAGGHLAELLATTDRITGLEGDGGWEGVSSKVQAAAAYYGVSDFTVGATQFQHPQVRSALTGKRRCWALIQLRNSNCIRSRKLSGANDCQTTGQFWISWVVSRYSSLSMVVALIDRHNAVNWQHGFYNGSVAVRNNIEAAFQLLDSFTHSCDANSNHPSRTTERFERPRGESATAVCDLKHDLICLSEYDYVRSRAGRVSMNIGQCFLRKAEKRQF